MVDTRLVPMTQRRAEDLAIVAQILSNMNLPGLAGSLVMTCEAWDAAPADPAVLALEHLEAIRDRNDCRQVIVCAEYPDGPQCDRCLTQADAIEALAILDDREDDS